MDKIDKFHWHEALHTSHIIQNLINNELIDHHTWEHLSEDQQLELSHAAQLIYNHYVYCCGQQDKCEFL